VSLSDLIGEQARARAQRAYYADDWENGNEDYEPGRVVAGGSNGGGGGGADGGGGAQSTPGVVGGGWWRAGGKLIAGTTGWFDTDTSPVGSPLLVTYRNTLGRSATTAATHNAGGTDVATAAGVGGGGAGGVLPEDAGLQMAVLSLRLGGGSGGNGSGALTGSSNGGKAAGAGSRRGRPSAGVGGASEPAGLVAGSLGLSQGQQQLLCLARMLLQKRQIVLLDEVTAAVDPGTSTLMRAVLADTLRGATVLQIAHDLEAVLGYDRVAVMEGGTVAEAGPPRALLEQQGSRLAALAAAAGVGVAPVGVQQGGGGGGSEQQPAPASPLAAADSLL
jgi:hypothetical protein